MFYAADVLFVYCARHGAAPVHRAILYVKRYLKFTALTLITSRLAFNVTYRRWAYSARQRYDLLLLSWGSCEGSWT